MSSPSTAESLTDRNRVHFDNAAATYDSPTRMKLAQKCVAAILEEFGIEAASDEREVERGSSDNSMLRSNLVQKLDEEHTTVLDFACGTGNRMYAIGLILELCSIINVLRFVFSLKA